MLCLPVSDRKGPMHSRDFFFFLSGTFGKPLRRPHLEAFSSFGQTPDGHSRACHLKPSSSPGLDSESEEEERERTGVQEENPSCSYKQTLGNYRTPTFQSYALDT